MNMFSTNKLINVRGTLTRKSMDGNIINYGMKFTEIGSASKKTLSDFLLTL